MGTAGETGATGATAAAGAVGAAGAAAALAYVNTNPFGDRSTLEHPDVGYDAVDCEGLKEMADEGDMQAQFRFGYLLKNGWFANYPNANEVGFLAWHLRICSLSILKCVIAAI
jgi:hypothetical protein